jgi:hypothetical protein
MAAALFGAAAGLVSALVLLVQTVVLMVLAVVRVQLHLQLALPALSLLNFKGRTWLNT